MKIKIRLLINFEKFLLKIHREINEEHFELQNGWKHEYLVNTRALTYSVSFIVYFIFHVLNNLN